MTDSASFDLDAYLARIRLADAPAADAEGLATIQHAHRLAIPFENLDIRLGRGIAIDSESVFAKLVTAKRGGYCFEQNRLFLDALTAIGFTARALLGRVWIGETETPGLTHMSPLVTIDGRDWLADAGFGGSYTPPLPLKDGATATAPDGAVVRLCAGAHGWMLSRDAGEGWVDQHSFTLARVEQADLVMSNHWTATALESRFVRLLVMSIALPTGFASLVDRSYRRHAGGATTNAMIDDARVYRLRLSMMFGIDLSAEEVAALGLF